MSVDRIPVRALVSDGAGAYRAEVFAVDPPGPGEVLVEVRASGVCHTDLDSLAWGRALILGHEGAGVVVRVGPGVDHVTPGDAVVLNWAIPCGACVQCRRGAETLCEARPRVPAERYHWSGGQLSPSFGLGTMATHSLVPAAAVVRIVIDIPFPSAAILGCGVMTGFGSVTNVAKVAMGSNVVVLGVGGVGLSCVQGAAHAGAKTIIAVDVHPARLEASKRFGATHTILAAREDAGLADVAKQVKALLGRGADYAFECTGVPDLAAAPLAMVPNGGVAIAVSGVEQVVPIDMRLFEFDKIYINPLYGQCRPQVDFPRLLRLYAGKRLKLDEMVTSTYPLSEHGLACAFEDMRRGRGVKAVLVPGDP